MHVCLMVCFVRLAAGASAGVWRKCGRPACAVVLGEAMSWLPVWDGARSGEAQRVAGVCELVL